MPTTQDALAALQNVGSGQDLIQRRLLAEQQAKEAARNIGLQGETQAQDLQSRFTPRSPGEARKDSMMGWDQGGVRSFSGATPGDYADLQRTLSESPTFGDAPQAEVADTLKQTHDANLQGFADPQEAAATARQAALLKTQMPLLTEQEKTRGAMQLENQNYDRLSKILGPHGQPETPPAGPAAPPTAGSPPPQSQGLMDFITGSGPNSLRSLGSSALEKAKYGVMATPYAKLNQDVSFANLQQLSGQFPGVRGFSYLLPKLAEHQANLGKETWQATYNRLKGMDQIMGDTENELNDPSLRVGIGADGKIKVNMPPQTVARGQLAIRDAHMRLRDAIGELERLQPSVMLEGQGGGAPQGGRFTRLPE